MTESTWPGAPDDGHVLANHAPGLVSPLTRIRKSLHKALEHDLRPGVRLYSASDQLGLLGLDADHVAACYRDPGPNGDHDHQMIHAAEHLADLVARIRTSVDTAPQTTDTVRLVLGQIDQVLRWLGTDMTTRD
jgi:hypothetical protein